MANSLERYLAKRAIDFERWPLEGDAGRDVQQVVVIPALGERARLFGTLASLAQNPEYELARMLVIFVVNNRTKAHARAEDIEDNQETLAKLRGEDAGVRLGIVDAASPGKELPEKDGVGLARKIGMDWALRVFVEGEMAESEPGVILCLDADATVEPNYLEAVRHAMSGDDAWAGTVDFAHPMEGDEKQERAIVAYELFLRYYVEGLRQAGSPYAFHTIGSTMVCAAGAYAAVSGMNRRRAAEDFYFLQQLAKTGTVRTINETTLYPAARPSHRVPFGTGASVTQFLERDDDVYPVLAPECFGVLHQWLELIRRSLHANAGEILAESKGISPELAAFLKKTGFEVTWKRLQAHARDDVALAQQFHRWFDALKTLRLMHWLRDEAFGEADVVDVLCQMLCHTGDEAEWRSLVFQKALLQELRGIARAETRLMGVSNITI